MDRSEVIKLVGRTHTQNEYGVMVPEETETEVFCAVESVTANEFFNGGRNGLNPQYRFTMFSYDYDGQEVVEYNNKRYTVYRTYHGKNDSIELYTEMRNGNANQS